MLSALGTTALEVLLSKGAGLTVSADLDAKALEVLASKLQGNAVLHIVGSEHLDVDVMSSIASKARAPSYVMFS